MFTAAKGHRPATLDPDRERQETWELVLSGTLQVGFHVPGGCEPSHTLALPSQRLGFLGFTSGFQKQRWSKATRSLHRKQSLQQGYQINKRKGNEFQRRAGGKQKNGSNENEGEASQAGVGGQGQKGCEQLQQVQLHRPSLYGHNVCAQVAELVRNGQMFPSPKVIGKAKIIIAQILPKS